MKKLIIHLFLLLSSTINLKATVINFQTFSGSFASEVSWDLQDNLTGTSLLTGSGFSSNSTYNSYIDLPNPGNYTLIMYDSFGDGWNGAFVNIIDSISGNTILVAGLSFTTGSNYTEFFSLPYVFGCTDSNADNYDSLATIDDGSCIFLCDTLEIFQSWENASISLPWQNSITNSLDWTINSGSTPSSNTGPSNAYDGNYYIYTETNK